MPACGPAVGALCDYGVEGNQDLYARSTAKLGLNLSMARAFGHDSNHVRA